MASYITMIANMADIANSKLPPPYRIPEDVARAQTVAEWELGIPPLPTILSATNLFEIIMWISVFNTCATNHPRTADIKI